ncbi:DNA polymerase alpha/epsilon, subunit B [Lasallia pustulata]|uniref:DNA polymerase epsilon subunit B n=1 Tax=Lasallia pustulata TaxID=136370 RepID=A0A1W5CWJ5_9LECA|nr:DNA polymerase alpha/epsilon, subunit B [Lasallia pustulata]
MNRSDNSTTSHKATTFHAAPTPAHSNVIPSSSPAFGTPIHPIRLHNAPAQPTTPSILPILLPPATLRPLAFRIFTKKHNVTLTSSALQALATFIGKHCGSGWRVEGLAERVLEEIAKTWKKGGGGVIVDGDGEDLKLILRNLEGCMSGGKITQQKGLTGYGSFALGARGDDEAVNRPQERPDLLGREDSQSSLGISALGVKDNDEEDHPKDPRRWLTVIEAFEQPRLIYNVSQKHFEKAGTNASLLPPPSHKTHLFRHRYNLVHQRLLRNESFQTPTIARPRAHSLQRSSSTLATAQQAYKLTPIASLLGRNGSSHLLLGLLTIAPTGTLAITDLTGSIALDLQHAKPVPEDGAWFTPGMIVLIDGVYEEEGSAAGPGLGGGGGVGGTIGGKFLGFSVGGPPCERREITLGLSAPNGAGEVSAGGGFGWVDFLGVGSERASGTRMRRLERSVLGRTPTDALNEGRGRVVIMGELNLDNAMTLRALRKVLSLYAAESAQDSPMTVVLVGNFVQHAVMAGAGSGGSIEYKEYFNSLASTLSDYPTVLQAATFIFVPGDNDPWASAFSAGAATALPKKGVPELFTSRVKRAFATANSEAEKSTGKKMDGEAVWTSNPSRLSLFGPAQEVVIFRDDMSSRLRRGAIRFQSSASGKALAAHADKNHECSPGRPAACGADEASESMEIDQAVEAAESHIPAGKATRAVSSTMDADLLTARKLVKTVLDQGYLSPFPLTSRPVLWDYAGALQLYPLPTALVLVDPEAPPFALTYEGCHVMNPGKLVAEGRRGIARWVEYDASTRRGKTRETTF